MKDEKEDEIIINKSKQSVIINDSNKFLIERHFSVHCRLQ